MDASKKRLSSSIVFVPSQFPEESSEYKIKVWELYLLYPNVRLLALPSSMDKAIATHTIGYVGSQ